MNRTQFLEATRLTPMSEKLRDAMARAYGKQKQTCVVTEIEPRDVSVLADMGYRLTISRGIITIQL